MKTILDAAREGDAEAIRGFLAAGVPVDELGGRKGSTPLMEACGSRHAGIEILKLLLDAGASINGVPGKRPPVQILAAMGRFQKLAWLLSQGADPSPLEWPALHLAVATGSREEVLKLIISGADLEERDWENRTPFLLAANVGDCEKASLLLEAGSNRDARGHGGNTALNYAIPGDNIEMLRWLLERGLDPDSTDDDGDIALMDAFRYHSEKCWRLLLEIEDRKQPPLDAYDCMMTVAWERPIIEVLIERGANPAFLDELTLCKFINLRRDHDLQATREDFIAGHFPRYGTANPERTDIPFWKAMVRCGWTDSDAREKFPDVPLDPDGMGMIWSYCRGGMSLTPLPDGRFIRIGGAHPLDGDPDTGVFYNDVIIHDGRGDFEILAYPGEDFPSTSAHTATLLGPWIYIIGNGNTNFDEPMDQTPVYRFHTGSGVIEEVATYGESPGWIHGHHATLEHGKLRITGAAIVVTGEDGKKVYQEIPGEFLFDPESGYWERA